MPRPSQLPPRCPFQRKANGRPTHEPGALSPPRVNESGIRHHKSLSHSSTLDDQPAWLDDLLNESDSNPRRIFHSRSASDSASLFDGFVPNMMLSSNKNEEHSDSKKGGNTLESSCVYGPNSPRRRYNTEFSDSSLLLALSDYVSQSPVQCIEDISQSSGTRVDCASNNELDSEPKTGKRHPGQRSRARKLQYIAELERNVNVLQALESELAIRISTQLQQKVILAMENNKLKQQLARLQQQKLILDGEYQSLRKEAERLKLGLSSSLASKFTVYAGSSDTDDNTEVSGQMLDWKKLHL